MGFPLRCSKCGGKRFTVGVYQDIFLVLFCCACGHEMTIDIVDCQLYTLPLTELAGVIKNMESREDAPIGSGKREATKA